MKEFDKRWTPLIQNQPLNFLANTEEEEANRNFRNYLYTCNDDFKIATSNHNLGIAKEVTLAREILGVKVGEFDKFIDQK